MDTYTAEQNAVLARFKGAVDRCSDMLQLRTWKIYVKFQELKNPDGTFRENWAEVTTDSQGRIASVVLNSARCLDPELDPERVALHECLEIFLAELGNMAASAWARGWVETELHRVIRVLEFLLVSRIRPEVQIGYANH